MTADNATAAINVVIGSGEKCTIQVHDDPYVSLHHAQITKDEDDNGRYWIRDLGSTNGTWIKRNGGRFRVYGPTLLMPGDEIWLGGRTRIPWSGSY